MNICEKYYWIKNHPAFVPFANDAIIEITPHMVCPETNRVENLELINTKLQFWVELMVPFYDDQFERDCHAHEWELDCGGDTWEEAVENLYQGVLAKYGNYTKEDYKAHMDKAMEGFDYNNWMTSVQIVELGDEDYEYAEPVLYTEDEISELKDDISKLESYENALRTKAKDPSITMGQYCDIETELMCIDHDLTIANASLLAGYDVDRYGLPK